MTPEIQFRIFDRFCTTKFTGTAVWVFEDCAQQCVGVDHNGSYQEFH